MTNVFDFLHSWFVGRNDAMKPSTLVRFLFANLHLFTMFFVWTIWMVRCWLLSDLIVTAVFFRIWKHKIHISLSPRSCFSGKWLYLKSNYTTGDAPIFHWTMIIGARIGPDAVTGVTTESSQITGQVVLKRILFVSEFFVWHMTPPPITIIIPRPLWGSPYIYNKKTTLNVGE